MKAFLLSCGSGSCAGSPGSVVSHFLERNVEVVDIPMKEVVNICRPPQGLGDTTNITTNNNTSREPAGATRTTRPAAAAAATTAMASSAAPLARASIDYLGNDVLEGFLLTAADDGEALLWTVDGAYVGTWFEPLMVSVIRLTYDILLFPISCFLLLFFVGTL